MLRKHLVVVLLILVASVAYCQMAGDEPPTPDANQLFTSAFQAECKVFLKSNPARTTCGHDILFRNRLLQAWGKTTPELGLQTQTRYNPDRILAIPGHYGPSAVFFVFAHEVGHHFDLQFGQPVVPWHVNLPAMASVPPAMVNSWNNELRADAWAGCALAVTGGDLPSVEALQNVTKGIGDNPDVPPTEYAQLVISAGYNGCKSSSDADDTTIVPQRFGPLGKKPTADSQDSDDDDTTIKPGCFGPNCPKE